MVAYFFDTYAIIELLMRNPQYKKYETFPLVCTILNKIEVGWWALKNYDEKLAQILTASLSNPVEITDDLILEALRIRKQHNKRDISYADAIGYAFALKNNLIFLTGDKQFKDLPKVEYVK